MMIIGIISIIAIILKNYMIKLSYHHMPICAFTTTVSLFFKGCIMSTCPVHNLLHTIALTEPVHAAVSGDQTQEESK